MNVEQAREKMNEIGFDWLAVAIGGMGGPESAAKKLKVTEATIIRWLEYGLAGVRFDKIVELARVGDVPLDLLAQRLGAFLRRDDWMEAYTIIEVAEKHESVNAR